MTIWMSDLRSAFGVRSSGRQKYGCGCPPGYKLGVKSGFLVPGSKKELEDAPESFLRSIFCMKIKCGFVQNYRAPFQK